MCWKALPMFSALFIPTFAPARRAEAMDVIATATAGLPNLLGSMFAPTLPNVYNGGDAIWRATFADAAACDAALSSDAWKPAATLLADKAIVTQLDHATFAGGMSGERTQAPGLYRIALFCANVRPDAERLQSFAEDTAALAAYVRTIGRWQLSTTRDADGLRPWTHVWEQEYSNLDGLNGAYMRHPAHWARAERWFDPEYPEHLVDPLLVHTFCAIETHVLHG
jgi:hypothetical protein